MGLLGQAARQLLLRFSRFILYYSYKAWAALRPTRFYRARSPGSGRYALTMIIAFGLAFVPNAEFLPLEWDWTTPFAALANLLIIHSWIPLWEMPGTFNEVSWSISIELFFYLLFPLALYKWSMNWKYWILGSIGVITGLIILCNLYNIPSYIEYYPGLTTAVLFHQGPLARTFEFLLGMTIGLFFIEDSAGLGKTSGRKSSRDLWTLAEAGSIALVLLNMIVALRFVPEARELLGNGAGSWLANAGACLSSALMIFVLAYHEEAEFQDCSPAACCSILGESSFALYLIHNLYFATFRTSHHPLLVLPTYLQFPIYVAAIVAISYCSWRWFETPMRNLLAPKKAKPFSERAALLT